MAVLKLESREEVIEEGERTFNVAEKLGVPMSCRSGICGSCLVHVVEGEENLEEQNEEEKEFGLQGNERLMCQCKIKSETVRIEF